MISDKIFSKLLLVVSICLISARASAALIQIDVSATFTSQFSGFPAPKTFQSQFVFDTDDVLFVGTDQIAYGLVSSQTTVDGATYSDTGGGRYTYQDQVPFPTPIDRLDASADYNFALDGVNVERIGFVLEGSEDIFEFDDIPFLPDPAAFFSLQMFVVFSGGTCNNLCAVSQDINASDIQIQAVPLPSAIWFFATGLSALMARARVAKTGGTG